MAKRLGAGTLFFWIKAMKTKPKDLSAVLTKLMKSGVRAERIAFDLDVAFGTVKSWVTGRRKPKTATVKQIESIYGVRIL